jgi:hypothetical protein
MRPTDAWCGSEIEKEYSDAGDGFTCDFSFCRECLTKMKAVEEASLWLDAKHGDSELPTVD